MRALVGLLLLLLLPLGCGDDAGRSGTPSAADTASDSSPPRRGAPNVVVITLDTTRADALGFMGQTLPSSPHIDRMALAGTHFTNAITSSPMTLPSHATIFSGLHPYAHGIRSNAGYVLADRTLTLAEMLAARGYRTGAEIAVDVLRRQTGIDQGFEHFRGPNDPGSVRKRVLSSGTGKLVEKPIRTDENISMRGIDFLRENRDRPFFLWLHYFGAHQPHVVPSQVQARFPDDSYHAAVAVQDAAVGRVLREIEDLGLRENTIVVLTADHGEGLGEHREDTHSYYVYDSTMHVPLVFWGAPSIPSGRIVRDVVRTIDIAPTLLELIGIAPPETIQGVSLVPLMKGSGSGQNRLAYGETFEPKSFFGLDPIRFVREGRWKYIHKVKPELYDVVADPGELDNRADDEPEIVARLRGRLEDLLAEAPEKSADATAPIDPAMKAQLQALGYVGEETVSSDFDEVASLDVKGEDPVDRIETLGAVIHTLELIENERYDEALANLKPLAEELPDSIYVHERLAQTHAARGAPREAIISYRRVLELNPCEERTLTEMNRLLKVVGDYEGLIEVLGRGVENCPTFAANLNNYAWALATLPRDDLRNGEAAVAAAERAVELMHRDSPALLDTLAVALAEAGRFDEAIEVQTEALRLGEASQVPTALIEELRQHLAEFREGRPIRSPGGSS